MTVKETMQPIQNAEPNIFIQHIPPYVEGLEPKTFEFNSTEELLSNPMIIEWKNPEWGDPKKPFFRYSLSDYRLMGEFDEGKRWWVIGFIKYPDLVNLPGWKPIIIKG